MLEGNVFVPKWDRLKNKLKTLFTKNRHSKPLSAEELEKMEFTPLERVSTAPRTEAPMNSTVSSKARDHVWDNEDASMQDKSYSFDEVTTDEDYDIEEEVKEENRYR